MAKILVVEDEFPLRLGLKYLLEDSGHEVFLVRDSLEALDMLTRYNFDLATVDLRMPNESGQMDEDDGIELLEEMERLYSALPAIVLTVRNDREATEACKHLKNVKEYMVKDPQPDRLKGIIEKILNSSSGRSTGGGAHAAN